MLRNMDTCAGESQKNASVLCEVDQYLSTKKRRGYFICLQNDK